MPLDGVTTNENDRPPLDKGGLQGVCPDTLNPFLRRPGTTASFVFDINVLTPVWLLFTPYYGPCWWALPAPEIAAFNLDSESIRKLAPVATFSPADNPLLIS